jgi:hypothetical protein
MVGYEWLKLDFMIWWFETWARMVGSCGDWSSLDLVLFKSVKVRLLLNCTWELFFYKPHAYNGHGKLSSISRTIPWPDSVRGGMRCDRPCPVHLYTPDRSFIVGCGYVKGWWHELTLILDQGYGRWSCASCGKSCTPLQGKIYCNSLAPGLRSTLLKFAFNVEFRMEFSKDWA